MRIIRTAFRALTYVAVAYGSFAAYTFLRYGKKKKSPPAPSLDRFLPEPEVVEWHCVNINAPQHLIYDAMRNYDVMHSRIAHLLFETRSVAMGSKPADIAIVKMFVDQMRQVGWAILDEKPDEEIIFGVAAQPWIADAGFRTISPELFATFNEPGWVKIVLNVAVSADGVLSTETRVVSTDAEARKRFRRYWAFVLPGVKLIRFELLRGMKAQAEAAARAFAAA